MSQLRGVFSVVNFDCDNSVEVVPTTWLDEKGRICLWPKKYPNNFAVLKSDPLSVPGCSWQSLEVTLVSTYGKD
jgi:hypothetical protein